MFSSDGIEEGDDSVGSSSSNFALSSDVDEELDDGGVILWCDANGSDDGEALGAEGGTNGGSEVGSAVGEGG